MSGEPAIDGRTGEDVTAQALALRTLYTPEWTSTTDSGTALVSIFARLMEILISRLNRAPEKNFLAFLDAAGVRLRPPKASRLPMRFVATAGAKKDGFVPAGTQLASEPLAGQAPLTFETEKSLTVLRAHLVQLFSMDPDTDAYADHQATLLANERNEDLSFQPFAGALLVPHRIYLSQDTAFRIDDRAKLTIAFQIDELTDAIGEFFRSSMVWAIHAGAAEIRPVAAATTANPLSGELTVTLDDARLDLIPATKVDGVQGFWIEAEASVEIPPEIAALRVLSIGAKAEATDLRPVAAFFNATALDVHREYHPFGERPKLFDTFFVAIPEAFGKAGSQLTLLPAYVPGTAGPDGAELTYEFWDGVSWSKIGTTSTETSASGLTDETRAFTAAPSTTGPAVKITFICPALQMADVGGKKDLWLRIRITRGDYGRDASMALTASGEAKQPADRTLADWTYQPATYKPPVIISLIASYAYTAPLPLTAVRTENNFTIAAADPAAAFQPFQPPADREPACYMAFDSPFVAQPVSLYIAADQSALSAPRQVVWEYWNGSRWANLGVVDGTKNLTESGLVEFIGPGDAAATACFGRQGQWLRARLAAGDAAQARCSGLFVNVVWARNATTLSGELLGSSTERPKARFNLSRFPILEGLRLEVREPETPSDEDLKALSDEEGTDAVTPVREGAGALREAWVRWHEVEHFRFSASNSRHYIIDWLNGTIQFGDGVHGMVPPAGRDNVRASSYQVGGGAAGNAPRNTVNVLKRAIPFVDSAVNVDAAGGGSDGESVAQLKVRGPQAIKNRGRAVTWEDFEWLAREASFEVARARCLPATSKDDAGKVRLVLVPRSDARKPYPSRQLIREVGDYLGSRTRRLGTADLVITGPKYIEISISANVTPIRLEEADLVRRRVKDALARFFHPLHGGPEEVGWEFGRNVFTSEVSKVIEDTAGVDHAEGVEIAAAVDEDGNDLTTPPADAAPGPLSTEVEIGDAYLVVSGDHAIAVNGVMEPA